MSEASGSAQGDGSSTSDLVPRGPVTNVLTATRFVWSTARGPFLGAAAVSVVNGALPPIGVWLSKRLVDLIVLGISGQHVNVVPVAVALALTGGLGRVLASVSQFQQMLVAERVEIVASRRFLEVVSHADLGHFDDTEWQNRMQRATEGLGYRPINVAYSMIGLPGTLVTLAGLFGVVATLHPVLLLLTLVSVVPTLTVQHAANRQRYAFAFEVTNDRRIRQYLKETLGSVAMTKELRAFQSADYLLDRFSGLAEREYSQLRALLLRAGRASAVSALVSAGALAGVYLFIAEHGISGRSTPGALTAMIAAISTVIAQLGLLMSTFAVLDQNAPFLSDYFNFLDPVVLVPPPAAPPPPRTASAGLRFEHVSFEYPSGSEPVLRDVSFHVAPDEMLALVGVNGAGKSTIVKLLMRFYDVTTGRITLDGVDIRDIDPVELRRRIGVLFQDFGTYQFTARENITIGRIDAPADEARVLAALEGSRAQSVIADLPGGLNTPVGRLLPGGHDLSGGQWQRLALARLIYRAADLWILDEPTAALDAEAEAQVFDELRQSLRGRMGIIISHRFSTVRAADRIAVIEHGRLLEFGSHDELVTANGRYSELFELQAAGYR